MATISKRLQTLKKKAEELSTLCGIDTAVIVFDGSTNKPQIWPDDPREVGRILKRFRDYKEYLGGRSMSKKTKIDDDQTVTVVVEEDHSPSSVNNKLVLLNTLLGSVDSKLAMVSARIQERLMINSETVPVIQYCRGTQYETHAYVSEGYGYDDLLPLPWMINGTQYETHAYVGEGYGFDDLLPLPWMINGTQYETHAYVGEGYGFDDLMLPWMINGSDDAFDLQSSLGFGDRGGGSM